MVALDQQAQTGEAIEQRVAQNGAGYATQPIARAIAPEGPDGLDAHGSRVFGVFVAQHDRQDLANRKVIARHDGKARRAYVLESAGSPDPTFASTSAEIAVTR